MELLFQVLFELLLQFLIEGVFDLLFGKTAVERPVLRAFFFLFVGAVAGGISLAVVPHHVIGDRSLRIAAALVIPFVVGFVMSRIGAARRRRGSSPNSLEYFLSSWAFAFAFGVIRVGFAR